MSWPRRALLIVAGLLLLIFAANNATADAYERNEVLATVQFVLAVGLLYWAARRG